MSSSKHLESLQVRAERAREQSRRTLESLPDRPLVKRIEALIEELTQYQTELQVQNAQLRESEANSNRSRAQYGTLFNTLPLAALVVDDRGQVVQANHAATRAFGGSTALAVRQFSVLRLIDPVERQRVMAVIRDRRHLHSLVLERVHLAARLHLEVHDLHLIHLSADYHFEHHTLILFVDQGAQAARERAAALTSARLALRQTVQRDAAGLAAIAANQLVPLLGADFASVERVDRGSGAAVIETLAAAASTQGCALTPSLLAQVREAAAAGDSVASRCTGPRVMSPEGGGSHRSCLLALPLPDGGAGELLLTLARRDRAFGSEDIQAALDLGQALADELLRLQSDLRLLQLSTAVEQSIEGVMITSLDGCVNYVNPSFTRITGFPGCEIMGRTPEVLDPEQRSPLVGLDLVALLEREGSWQGEAMHRNRDGRLAPYWVRVSPIRGLGGQVEQLLWLLVDITQRRADEEKIHQLAYFDPLTGLPNRRLLGDRLKQLAQARQRGGPNCAVLFIDLDQFKHVNDSLGHASGDALLKVLAGRIQHCVRAGDTVARVGGDEFVVLLPQIATSRDEAIQACTVVAAKIRQAMLQPVPIQDARLLVTASIGIAVLDHQDGDIDALFRQADCAMYEAKSAGRDTIRFFNADMQRQADARAVLERQLARALEREELMLYFQPQIDRDLKVLGFEALIRWQHPERGVLLPDQFIPLAEQSGLIHPIGDWVIQSACRHLARMAATNGSRHHTLSINISARQFRVPDFPDRVAGALALHGVCPDRLELELTESVLLHDAEEVATTMRALNALGVRFALDDFGVGYSSMAYLQTLPLQRLKIDQRFVRRAVEHRADAEITRIMVMLGHSLGLEVVAEGVETAAQHAFLLGIECDVFQGFLHGMPAESLAGLPVAR